MNMDFPISTTLQCDSHTNKNKNNRYMKHLCKINRKMECSLPILLMVVLVQASPSMGAYEIAKPGCPDECGGVKIPFPFGIGDDSNCYLKNTKYLTNGSYRINCDHTTNPPVPFILDRFKSYREVLSINVDDHSLRVSSKVAFVCYTVDAYGEPISPTTRNNTYNLPSIWPFNISSTLNRFVAVGCDTTARVWDDEMMDGSVDSTGCITSCRSLDSVRYGACSGRGCCETSIFDGMGAPTIYVGSLTNHTQVGEFNPCSYAFVGEVGSFEFSVTNLTLSAKDFDRIRFPVVYDWSVVFFVNCSEAKKAGNGTLICGPNTHCVDGDDVGFGYRCLCLKGYAGNPYLSHGCQDIDECIDESLNQCQKREFCVNKKGGFECQCPKGFHGNGTSNNPCIRAPGPAKLVLGLSIGMGSMVGFVMLYGLYKLLKRRIEIKEREHNFKKNGGLLLQQEVSTNEGAIDRTKIFSQSELEKATDNFNDNRVLGRGGQGTVYKGMLVDGTIVAVKKSKKVDELQLSQFINEVAILSQINHRNVVKLFGCCLETEVPLLVYEFVPNGTLYQHIHHPSEDFPMTWKVRFEIAVECAGAIAYLHSSCSSPIYHRDIKSSNILLDEKYKAKIADFGTSKTVSIDKTHVTTCVQGTFGYLDPEFFRSSQFSEKSDVYSFGVVLLELMTSMKPIFTDSESREPRGLATEFLQIMESSPDRLHGILDNQVKQNCSEEEIEALAKLIERCLSLNGKQRPTMRELAMTLETIKPQHDEQGIRWQELHLSTNNMSLTNEDLAYKTSTTLAFTDSSYSMDVEPLLFDSI